MIKKRFIWAVFAGALFLAQPHIVYAQSLPGPAPTGCYLTAHGDVQCPADPEAPVGRPGSGDPGQPAWTYQPAPSAPIFGITSCQGQNPLDVFREHARAREGYSTKVYRDALGNLTVGIGHRVTPEDDLDLDDEISPERVEEFWLQDSMAAFNAAVEQAKEAGICDSCFIAALASVNLQLGTNWTTKYTYKWSLIMAGKYDAAADRTLVGEWYQQTPVRARDFEMALRALPPKPPACVLNPPIVLPPKLCDIVPELCEPICYGDLCHCKMEPIPGEGPVPAAAATEPTAAPSSAAVPAASAAPAAASTAQCYDPTSCQADVTPGNFMSELNSKPCGCTLKMGPGKYPFFNYTKNCTAENPFILEAQAMGGPSFPGFNVNGDGLIMNGANVSGQITINGNYNRVTRTLFVGNGQVDFIEGSAFNRIDHNDLILPVSASGETNAAIAFYRPRSTAQMYNNNRIDSNYFTTNSGPSSATEGAAIFHCMYGAQDGYQYLSRYGSSRSLIENNLFENWGRKNVMEVKCSDNVFRNNTLINSGRVLSRHGYHNQYLNNYMQNLTTGLAIREYQQQVVGNYLDRARIILYGGTRKYPHGECYQSRDWMPPGYPGAPQGPPAVGTFLDKNRGPLSIGETEGAGCNVPVLNTTIACHEGPISKTNYNGLTGPTSTSCGFTMPHKLTRAEVGRGGPEGSCEVPVIPGGPVCTPVDGGGPPGEPEPLGPGIKLCYPQADGDEKAVCGEAAFRAALASAKPGDHIQLCAGNYGGTYDYNKNGTEAAPIVIEPQPGDNVVITGTFNMDGTYGVLTGMSFTDGGRINLDGEYNRVTKNRFHDFAIDGVISMSGNRHSHNRIDHNDFRNFRGGAIRADGIHSGGATALNHQGHRVDSNYFTNHSPLGINESVFLILTDSFNDMNLIYENNVFDNVLNNLSGQKELMSVKTAKTVVRGNTIMNSGDVTISIRESNRSIVENNCLKDGALIRVHGDDNVIRNNRLEGGKIELRGGDCTMDCKQCDLGNKYTATIQVGSECKSAHTAARRAIVENNIARITVGDTFPGDNVPAQSNTVRNNSGPVQLMNETATSVTNGAPANTAVCLAPNQVGPLVPDTECPDN